jgi:hypothetical protein
MTYSCSQPYEATSTGLAIDVIWDNPALGPIPFTATPDDVETYGREIYQEAISGEYGPLVSYADSHWYSTTDNNVWEGQTYSLGSLMLSPLGVQPPNSTQTPPPQS